MGKGYIWDLRKELLTVPLRRVMGYFEEHTDKKLLIRTRTRDFSQEHKRYIISKSIDDSKAAASPKYPTLA